MHFPTERTTSDGYEETTQSHFPAERKLDARAAGTLQKSSIEPGRRKVHYLLTGAPRKRHSVLARPSTTPIGGWTEIIFPVFFCTFHSFDSVPRTHCPRIAKFRTMDFIVRRSGRIRERGRVERQINPPEPPNSYKLYDGKIKPATTSGYGKQTKRNFVRFLSRYYRTVGVGKKIL